SDIDPTVHGATVAGCQAWVPYPGYLAQGYQAHNVGYPNIAAAPRLVVSGDRTKANCDGGGVQYQGYFDCALTTPCDNTVLNNRLCGASGRKGCVKAGDSRLTSDPTHFTLAPCGTDTGMVFQGSDLSWNLDYIPGGTTGANARGILVYLMRGSAAPWTGTG